MKSGIAERIYKRKTIEQILKKARIANKEVQVEQFLITRIILCLVVYAASICIPVVGLVVAPFITIIFYNVLGRNFFERNIFKRDASMELELIPFIETLITALENKIEFKKALEITCEHVPGELSFEFKKVLSENLLGKGLAKAFDNMIAIIPNQNTINFINIINQANDKNVIEGLEIKLKYLKESRHNYTRFAVFKRILSITTAFILVLIPLIIIFMYAPNIIELLN